MSREFDENIHVEMIDVDVLVSRAHTNCQTSLHANLADIDAEAFKYIDNHVDNYRQWGG